MQSKTKIKSDLFNISKRIKIIDKNYFIVFDKKLKRFEVHNSSQAFNTLAFVCPYTRLDKRVLDFALITRVERGAQLLLNLEKNNEKLDRQKNDNLLDISAIKLKEIYCYAVRGGKEFDYKKSYLNDWI